MKNETSQRINKIQETSIEQSSTSASFIGIRKNSIPVFKVKLMNKGPTNYIQPKIEPIFKQPEVYPQKEIIENKPKLDSLVNKISYSSSQISQKNLIDNKTENINEPMQKNYYSSNDDNYPLEHKLTNNLGDTIISSDSTDNEIHKLHMLQSLQALQYLKTISPPPLSELKNKLVFLPAQNKKKTLIFDMDETLIHCVDSIEDENPQYVIKVQLEDEEVEAGINIRPYALECLETVNQKFEVVVFTASHQTYADAVLDFIDPEGDLIQKRLYRDSCFETEEGIYIKDLRIFANRRLEDLIIVDNAVYSFGFQLNNGIPIIPFYDDQNDEELFHLVPFLEILADCEDIREKNIEAFQLDSMSKNELGEFNRILDVSQSFLPEEDDLTDNYDSCGYQNVD